MKILIADKFPKHWTEVLQKQGYEIVSDPALDENTLPAAQATQNAEVIIVRSTKVNAAAIGAGANLKLVIRAGAGYDTIDIATAKDKGVAVCNCPGTNSIAVAELAFALILALDRHIADNVEDFRAGKWNKALYSKAKGLYGRTIGVIGLGAIGRAVITRAQAFGLRVIGYSRSLTDERAKELGITRAADIYDLAAKSDIVTLHLPAGADSKGLYDAKFFAAMKNGAYFINTSRGSLVKQADLINAIKEKNFLVGLDVYENEPKADAKEFIDPITKERNVYGTHHIGASTDQAQDAVAEMAVEIINTFKDKGEFLHQVNK